MLETVSDAAPPKEALPIVDTHQHLWDLSKFQPPWLESAPEVLRRSYTTREYLAETAGLKVAKAVYMEIDAAPEQQLAEARHVIALSKSAEHPTAAAVISGPMASAAFRDYILQFKKNSYIKGVRQVLHVPSAPRGLCLEKQFVANVRLLGELGMSYDLCMRPTELADGAKLAQECPDTRFVLDHCGNADPHAFLPRDAQSEAPWHEEAAWRKDVEALARCTNVICKISGIVARAPERWEPEHLAPAVNHCLDAFGPERVVFGSDWPVCRLRATYGDWVAALKQIIANRPLETQKKLLHDNAMRFYRLA